MDDPREYVTYDDSTAACEFVRLHCERRTATRVSIDCMGAPSYVLWAVSEVGHIQANHNHVYMHDVAQAS